MQSAAQEAATFGARLRYVRGSANQKDRAGALGVAVSSYQHYERDERSPDLAFLGRLMAEGWSVNWLISGEGAERLDQGVEDATGVSGGSQALSQETLKIALQMAVDLDVLLLPPPKQARMIELIYGLLVEGLPEAKVLVFARAAAA